MRQISAAERAAVWTVALVIVAAITALTAVHGALGIPRNDDWSYLRVALDLAETGQVQLTGWVQMFFIGQAVLAQPVITLTAGSTAALQIFVAALAVASLVLAYDLARRILPPALAALAVLPLALGPMFGSLALSFMTDIPALFLTLITLSFGAATLNANGRRRSILLACAAASGVFAFTIREYGLLAWIAVALTVLWQIFTERTTPRSSRNVLPVILLFGSSLVAAALLWAWRSQLPGTLATGIAIPRT
ncbi:MAG: glycosyltransferase family 39 protein, partial [Actinomycetales bacterium]|nr:glycosyltransferase family 39 protein [Actinomycetales bacterium]